MQIERRALYNLMRMNWLLDPSLPAEPWQVDDYRNLSFDTLFERLAVHEILLNRENFIAFAEEVDSPEEMVDWLLGDIEVDVVTQDQIYLLLFELWRRLVTDRPCLSIFCDEMDHQIYLYDHENGNVEVLQDAVANLQTILDENTDEGAKPTDVFASLSACCANDIENFLYDYISDQLDHGSEAYAGDLIDSFNSYIKEAKWFDFLRVRLLILEDQMGGLEFLRQLIDYYSGGGDLEFNMELLSFGVQHLDKELFVLLVKKTIPLIKQEEDFQDLISLCGDFYHYLDQEVQEQALHKMLVRRSHLHLESSVKAKDPQIAELLKVLAQ